MKKIKDFTILCCLLFMAVAAQAQSISGKLVDEQQQSLAYANIVIQRSDSTFVTGTTSDEKGGFRLTKVKEGDYRLVVSCVGYQTLYLDLQGFSRSTNLGTLTVKDASEQLGEVTVTASSLSATADKKMVFPSQQQVKASANGVDLLRNLMIPRLNVNPMNNTVSTTDGGTVQLAINGRKATKEEVTALQPSEIIRVEMMEDPGLRYGESDAVVNYVVRRYEMGGSFGYDGNQSTKSWFGQHNANGKLNFGKSEISIRYTNSLQYFNELWFDKNETFTFEDGKQYHRHAHTETDGKKSFYELGGITYNLQDDDKYMFNVSLNLTHYNDPILRFYAKLYTEEFPESVTNRQETSHYSELTPSIDLYYQRNLKNKQFLALNAVGTFIGTKNRNTYSEYLNDEKIVDYQSGVNGEKYSMILEGIYEKGFANGGKFTAGIKHTQGYTDNTYEGTLHFQTRMKQADTYGYAQYKGKWKRLGYSIGLGATRSWFRQEGQEEYETWSFNPRFNLTYTFNKHWSAAFQGNISTMNPSLSQLSAADQLTDSLQIERGNPNLRPYDYYRSTFRLNYNKDKWNIGFFGNYRYRDDAIMSHIYRENGKFIHSYANHDNFQQLNVGINARVGMLWNVLQLSGSIYSDTEWSNGLDYRHTHHSIGWDITAMLMYKNFMVYAMYQHSSDSFFGEHLATGEEAHLIQLQYRLKNVNIGLRMYNPFQRDYARKEVDKNQYAGYDYEYHIDDVARTVTIKLSWNFSFGRDYKSKNKRMNNSDSESGVM